MKWGGKGTGSLVCSQSDREAEWPGEPRGLDAGEQNPEIGLLPLSGPRFPMPVVWFHAAHSP